MKNLFLLWILLFDVVLNAQTHLQPTEQLIKVLAKSWGDPAYIEKINSRRGGGLVTHTLDSIVLKNEASAVVKKIEIDYNAQGYSAQTRQYSLNVNTSILGLENVISFEYQTPGYVSHILVEYFDSITQQLKSQSLTDIGYDGSNRIDSLVKLVKYPFSDHESGIKLVYNGDLLMQIRWWDREWWSGNWILSSVIDYQYDSTNRIIEKSTKNLSEYSNELIPGDRTTYSYNAQGLADVVTDYYWDGAGWQPLMRSILTYYSNRSLSGEFIEWYTMPAGTWDNLQWTTFPVEIVTDAYPYTTYRWYPAISAWNTVDSIYNQLNPSLAWSQVATPNIQLSLAKFTGLYGKSFSAFGVINDPEGSSILESQSFKVNPNTNQFYFDSRFIYYYGLIGSSGIDPVIPNYISIFPNPSKDQFNIQLDLELKASYTVHNITGVVVAKGQIGSGKQVVLTEGWVPGLYFIKIQLHDGSIFVQKQMIE